MPLDGTLESSKYSSEKPYEFLLKRLLQCCLLSLRLVATNHLDEKMAIRKKRKPVKRRGVVGGTSQSAFAGVAMNRTVNRTEQENEDTAKTSGDSSDKISEKTSN